MKTIYLIFPLLLFTAVEGRAQLTLTKSGNEPVVGDVHTTISHDSTIAIPKNKGTGQLWNFTTMTASSNTEIVTYTTTASVPQSSLYPGATIVALRGTNNKEFLMSSGSDWFFVGEYDNPSGDRLILSNNALFMHWPVSISNTFSDVAAGTDISGTNSAVVTATLNYEASGSGTVVLPGGIMHNNCLQITSTLVVVTGTGTGASTMTQMQYIYYSSLRKLPIGIIQYQTETGSSGTTKDYSAYIDLGPLSTGIKETTTARLLDVYPNPSNDIVFLNLTAGFEQAKMELRDGQGKLVLRTDYSPTIDVSLLPSGIYFLSVQTNDAIVSKKVVINR